MEDSAVAFLQETDTFPELPELSAPPEKQLFTADDIMLSKELLYDKYTLENTYPYQDTICSFKWEVIRNCLAYIENMQGDTTVRWVVMQNYKKTEP